MGGDRNSGRDRVIRKKIEMDDDKLIECVRKNPSLYEIDHANYASGVARAKTWKAIGAELKRHPLFCKRRWGNIRDNYKKAMKKYYWRVAQGYTKIKKYKFCDKLDFLANQIEDTKDNDDETKDSRNSCTNDAFLEVKCEPDIDPDFDDNDRMLYDNNYNKNYDDDDNDDYIDQAATDLTLASQFEIRHIEENTANTEQFDNYSQVHDARVNESSERVVLEEDEDNKDETEGEQHYTGDIVKRPTAKIETTNNSNHSSRHLRFRKKRKLNDSGCELSSCSKSTKYIVERVEEERFTEKHPVDAFLSGIAPTLKSLSPYYLSLAKTQIYSIVQEYEMAMIMEKRNENHRL